MLIPALSLLCTLVFAQAPNTAAYILQKEGTLPAFFQKSAGLIQRLVLDQHIHHKAANIANLFSS